MDKFYGLHEILNVFSDGILLKDSEKNFFVNDKFKELFNINKEDSTEIARLLDLYGLLNDLKFKNNTEKKMVINNKKIIIETYNRNIPDLINISVSVFKEIIDVDLAKTEIDELKMSLNVMKDILDNAYQGLVLVNEEGIIVKWNYEKLFGIKEEDVLGKHVEDIIENTRLHLVVKTGQKELYDIQRIQGHDMIASRTPIIRDGNIIGAVGTVLFKDVKEVKDLAMKLKALENTVKKYKSELGQMYCAYYTFDHIITQNKKMVKLKEIAKKAAYSSSTILIVGESGTGKEYFAHAIHDASSRNKAPFVKINCAAIPYELLESELFGYESGSFTGAKRDGKIGKLELANGGTVLLDEISSMPMSMQAKLLRVLEEREFERIGGNTGIKIDIRVIACTNENLYKLVERGLFRHDLFFRLNVVEISIPPLRERMDDIELLCEDILTKQVQSVGLTSKKITDKAILALKLYDWPGNVRELRNILERAANMSTNNSVNISNLPDFISNKLLLEKNIPDQALLKDKIAKAEIEAIISAIKFSNGSRTKAAGLLGIHRTALYKKLAAYGIDIKNIV